jgi:hypothetical protein
MLVDEQRRLRAIEYAYIDIMMLTSEKLIEDDSEARKASRVAEKST